MKDKKYQTFRLRAETGHLITILAGIEQAKTGRIVRPDEILERLLKAELEKLTNK